MIILKRHVTSAGMMTDRSSISSSFPISFDVCPPIVVQFLKQALLFDVQKSSTPIGYCKTNNGVQYDVDITWSPQGRIHQVEYAMEAVKQGSCAVGLKGKEHVVLAALKRSQSELSSYQPKIFKIDDHMGIAISGLTADGRILSRYMRNECLDHRYVYETAMPVGRLVRKIADRSLRNTQYTWNRPYGVGLLVAGIDPSGPSLMQTCPSGNYYEFNAYAIGLRSQASRTYLEKTFEGFSECELDGLIQHALKALESSIQDGELTVDNCTVAVVGKDLPFAIIEGNDLAAHVASIKEEDVVMEDAQEEQDQPEAEGAAGGDEMDIS